RVPSEPAASRTCTAKAYRPARARGTPSIVPFGSRWMPAGARSRSDQRYGATPALALRRAWYLRPSRATGRDAVATSTLGVVTPPARSAEWIKVAIATAPAFSRWIPSDRNHDGWLRE